MKSEETYEQMMKDSDRIFKQITSVNYNNFEEVNRIICVLFVPDMSISRSGISHALKRLERYFKEKK